VLVGLVVDAVAIGADDECAGVDEADIVALGDDAIALGELFRLLRSAREHLGELA